MSLFLDSRHKLTINICGHLLVEFGTDALQTFSQALVNIMVPSILDENERTNTRNKLIHFGNEVLLHYPYSLDLFHVDYNIFPRRLFGTFREY